MPYKYYVEVQSDEHYLYASEIATILGYFTSSGKPYTRFVSYVYHANKKNKIFYQTRKGLREVFPLTDSDIKHFADLIKNSAQDKSGAYIVTVPGNKLEIKTFYVYTKEGENYFYGTPDF